MEKEAGKEEEEGEGEGWTPVICMVWWQQDRRRFGMVWKYEIFFGEFWEKW